MSTTVEEIKRRSTLSYTNFPKYQRLAYALNDMKTLIAEVRRLETWVQGLEATALKWANESSELRTALEATEAHNGPAPTGIKPD